MCRLLGYAARRPTSVVDALGAEEFEEFTALTAVHGDGWGMAWQDPDDDTVHSVSSPVSAVRDPTYAQRAREPLGRAGLVHLRWATPGLAVTPQNTHPFVDGGYAFAHNGHVSPVGRLEELLTPQSRAALRGDTDSERYFRFVRQCIAERGNDAEGLVASLAVLTAEFPRASLNALMLTPTHLYGVHVNSRAPAPVTGLRSCSPRRTRCPTATPATTTSRWTTGSRRTPCTSSPAASTPRAGRRCPRTPRRWSTSPRWR